MGASGAEVAHSLIFSPEMDSRNLSNGDFVDMLFMSLLNRSATAQERSSLVNELNRGASRFSVFARFIRSTEFARFCNTFNVIPGNAVDPSRPMVALTYDDGPSGFTNSLLDVLERYNVPATFYVNGNNIAGNESTILRALNLRCEIGNHGWSHANLTALPISGVHDEIVRTSNAIRSVTGVLPATFRPGYGAFNSNVVTVAAENGIPIINWTLNGEYDGSRYFYSAREVANNVINNSRSGEIVLLHDTYADIAAATEQIINELTRRGFQFVTVTELLYNLGIRLSPGQVYGQTNR